jgi:coenzyme PQQ precursor peptide PqqA
MQWTRPDFQEITLNMEVTAYVNTDDTVGQVTNLPSESDKPRREN